MRLTIAERMSLLDILPAQGSVVTLRLLADLRKKVALTEKEIEEYQVKQNRGEDGRVWVEWAPEFDSTRVGIPMTDHEKGIVIRELMKFDQNSQLTVHHLPLYDYFVDRKEPEET